MVIRLGVLIVLLLLVRTSERPLIAAEPVQPCKSTVTGTLEIIPFESKVYGDTRRLRVWLPSGYSAQASAKRYSVLYLFDGQFLFDRCTSAPFPDEWHVDETLTDLIARRAVQPLIVIGIDNPGPGRREDEYSRYGAVADAPQKLSTFMTREVLPLIDGRYRTIADRTHRGVGGSSLGSLAALSLLLDQPDTFGLGLLESTSLQSGNGRTLQETSTIVQGPLRISIGVGTAEVPPTEASAHGFPNFDDAFVVMSRQLAENIKKSLMNHPEVKLTVEAGGQHQPKYWEERFGPAVSFLFPPEPRTTK